MTVSALCQGDEHGRFFIVEVATERDLNVLDVLPSVDVTELDLCRVGNTGMKRFVVVVSQNGGVAKVNLRLKFLTNEIGHQVSIPIG